MSIGEGELALLLLLLTLWVGPVRKAGDVAHCEVLLLSLKEGTGDGQTDVVGILLGSSKKNWSGEERRQWRSGGLVRSSKGSSTNRILIMTE